MTLAEKKVHQQIQSIDAKLRVVRSKRWTAWNQSKSDEVHDFTCDINDLLDARLELTKKEED